MSPKLKVFLNKTFYAIVVLLFCDVKNSLNYQLYKVTFLRALLHNTRALTARKISIWHEVFL
jgi:hypothetical protein